MADISKKLAGLSPEQRKLFELKLKKLKQKESKKKYITKQKERASYPASSDQKRLWFINEIAPENAAYNIHATVRVSGGPFRVDIFEKSINECIRSHKVLRTHFALENHELIQVISPTLNINVPVIDLSHLDPEEKERMTVQHVFEELEAPFDLSRLPLIRVTVIKRSDTDHVLVFAKHHIITDWFSYALFREEVSDRYNSYVTGTPLDLPEVGVQFADFAVWQAEQEKEGAYNKSLDYWINHLSGSSFQLDLPFANSRPPVQTHPGEQQNIVFDQEIVEELKQLGRRSNVTIFMALTAIFQLILFRYTGQPDIIVSTPIANRKHAELERTLGFLLNMLALYTDFSGDPTFEELLTRVRKVILDAYHHQDLPFGTLLEHLNLKRDMSRNPVFQFSFIYLEGTHQVRSFHDRKTEGVPIAPRVSRLDMTLTIWEQGLESDGMFGHIEYNTDLYEQESMARMTRHFEMLMETVVRHPDVPISRLDDVNPSLSRLSLLNEEEKRQLLEWSNAPDGSNAPDNHPEKSFDEDLIPLDLFHARVEKAPDDTALAFEDRALTRGELNRRAHRVAFQLAKHGAKPGTVVGICVERSLDMIVGILGIMKAGAAYLPLSPSYPATRLGFMMQDAAVSIVLTRSPLLEKIPQSTAQPLCIDKLRDMQVEPEGTPAGSSLRRTDPVYTIYTSGSTGNPKGVVVEHRHLTFMLYAFEAAAPARYPMHGLNIAPFFFDASAWEFFYNLCFGGKLHILDAQTRLQPGDFTNYLLARRISCVCIPPALLEPVVIELETRGVGIPLKTLFIGIEAIKQGLAQRYRDLCPDLTILNGYGPTETTVCSTSFLFTRAEKPDNPIPIGRPFRQYRVFILDANLRLSAVGLGGELCIGGSAVARGYLNRPELTDEKFPCITVFNESHRLYRSGDMARWLPDGNLEFLGRIDHQVKFRGYRIELPEIEVALARHSAIKEAVVVLHSKDDNPRLAAYVTLIKSAGGTKGKDIEEPVAPETLNAWLKNRLPEYMVPAGYTIMDKFPLTPNGKIDRRSLPEPDFTAYSGTYEAPRTDIERRLIGIWKQILKLPDVGIHDNFFELGGDSILSIQIVGRARAAGLELNPRDLFQHNTIAELARVTRAATTINAEQGTISGDVPLTPIQQTFFERSSKALWHFNQAILLVVPPDINENALKQSLTIILQHHDALRLRFRQTSGQWEQSHASLSTDELPFHIEDHRQTPKENRSEVIRERSGFWQASMNLETGPLVRLVLLHLGDESRLLWCIHHLAVDGVSWRPLLEDLQTAYQQAVSGQSHSPPG